MVESSQAMLPSPFAKTKIYAYSGKTNEGEWAGFPGPSILAQKDKMLNIPFVNPKENQKI